MSFLQRYYEYGAKLVQAIEESLLNETTEAVKDTMAQQLDEDVYRYPASEMAMASRRYGDGGLQDRENMVPHIEYDTGWVLAVENVAPFQNSSDSRKGHDLSDVVEKALPGYHQPAPRPFIANTESECISSGNALKAFNEGMKKRGTDLESE